MSPACWKTEIELAAERIAPHVRRTPVLDWHVPGLERTIELKLEHLQHTGSFKVRGAFTTLLGLDELPAAGVVAASGGNHGAAVAHAARQLGLPARIFVPADAPEAKLELIRRTGAELVQGGGNYAAALEAARRYEAESGALSLHAYDGEGTVVGQGTLAREWEQQGLDADTVLIAVGGGGLVGGSMAWYQSRRRVVAVESEGCATLNTALREGPGATIQPGGLAKDSLGASRIGALCHALALEHPPTSVLVADGAIREAQRLLWHELHLLVEPGGATALAALLSGAYEPDPDEKVAVLLCGGNVSPDPTGA